MGNAPADEQRLITSQELSGRAIGACWTISLLLLAAGIAATFLEKAGAAAATMLAMGGILAVLALMKRIPLRFELAGTKLDATYPPDQAFDAGRENGLQEGLERAAKALEKAEEAGTSVEELRRELRDVMRTNLAAFPPDVPAASVDPGADRGDSVSGETGYSGPTACRVAGITYRQLDYWFRTGLVSPSIIQPSGQHLYSALDMIVLKVIKRLLDTGISLTQIRAVIEHLKGRSLADLGSITLLSDGDSVHEATSRDDVLEMIGGGHGVFGIAIGRVVDEVNWALRDGPPPSA